jgi:hypothetical protein
MVRWNKLSHASPYLVGVWFGVRKGTLTVCVTGSVDSLQILAIGLSRGLLIGMGISRLSRSFIDNYFFLFIFGTDVIL